MLALSRLFTTTMKNTNRIINVELDSKIRKLLEREKTLTGRSFKAIINEALRKELSNEKG